ncbi:MAG: polysaccharide deacetylase family protein [Weeksellaceae bacterium]
MINWFLKNIIKHSGKKIIFPFYHIISDEDCPHVKHLYPIKRIENFEKELDFLQKQYRPMDLEELMLHIHQNTQPKEPSFFLTFDDGLRECYTVIAPILNKRNIPAAFFLNTAFVGNKDLFYRYKISLIIDKLQNTKQNIRISSEELLKLTHTDIPKINAIAKELDLDFYEFLQKEKPYMNWREIEELKDQGFYFGGHSVNHPLYKLISLEEQIEQTQTSVTEVKEKLNLDYKIFSFPFTDDGVKNDFFKSVFEENSCDLTFATQRMKTDEFPQNIHRFGLEPNINSVEIFFLKRYSIYLLNSFFNKNKIIR